MSQPPRTGSTGLLNGRISGYFQSLPFQYDPIFFGVLGLTIGALYVGVAVKGLSVTEPAANSAAVVQPTAEPKKPASSVVAGKPLVRDVEPVAGAKAKNRFSNLPHFNIFGHSRPGSSLARRSKTMSGVIQVSSAADLHSKFAAAGFDLADVRDGGDVPRLTLKRLPNDLSRLNSVKTRKSLFIRGVLPLVLQANEAVQRDRQRLLKLIARNAPPGATDVEWLDRLAEHYGADKLAGKARLQELKRRVDIVPPSMALAQGAEESGWGTSRFAVEGNAVFGQWTYKKGKGMVPTSRDKGKSHEVKAFAGLGNSIEAYLLNLNTHWAYKDFRKARADLRAGGGNLQGTDLIGTLKRYSQRGEEYLSTLRTIIRVNGLSAYDQARLSDAGEDT